MPEFLVDSKHGGCQKIASLVKQKPLAINLVQIIALWLSVFDSAAWAQPSDQKPDKAFWPREVRISEEVKVEQKTKYGVVTSKRTAGSVVKVVSLNADSLTIESDGFFGKISVEKTDFWDRAEKTMDAANQRITARRHFVREHERRRKPRKG